VPQAAAEVRSPPREAAKPLGRAASPVHRGLADKFLTWAPTPKTVRATPISGFSPCGTSPFHFGGHPPPVPLYNELPACPPPTAGPAFGLPLRDAPDVPSARAAWVAQLDKLAALPGADTALIRETKQWVLYGVRAAFKDGPPPQQPHANTWTFETHKHECMERMRVYKDMGALRQLSGPPPPGAHVQPLHAVVKPGKKTRVCVDLARNFNDYLEDVPFQYSSLRDGVDLAMQCQSPAFFVKLDISSCFLSFPVHEDDLQYFYCEAAGDFYQFVNMMFGLKTAPRMASLLLDVVSSAIADAGVAHIRYLDDFLIVAPTADQAWASAHKAAAIINEFGLALAPGKVEGPLQRIEFLGIVIDSVEQTLSISENRKAELLDILGQFASCRWSSLRRLQSLLGKLRFAATVLPGARPFLRRIIDITRGRTGGRLRLSSSFQADVQYWRDHIDSWNGRERWRAPTSAPFVFASDASTSGFAYGLEDCPRAALASLPTDMAPGAVRAGVWSSKAGHAAAQQHSSAIQWGEFFCPLAAAVEFGPVLSGAHVVFVIDNESDTHVINRLRTKEPRVAALLRALCDTSLKYNFSFEAVHRYGINNKLMDWASRPALHKFSLDPANAPGLQAADSQCGGVGGGCTLYPPLVVPTRISFVNSRCLRFDNKASSASWAGASSGW
jgi:hypothetical protein